MCLCVFQTQRVRERARECPWDSASFHYRSQTVMSMQVLLAELIPISCHGEWQTGVLRCDQTVIIYQEASELTELIWMCQRCSRDRSWWEKLHPYFHCLKRSSSSGLQCALCKRQEPRLINTVHTVYKTTTNKSSLAFTPADISEFQIHLHVCGRKTPPQSVCLDSGPGLNPRDTTCLHPAFQRKWVTLGLTKYHYYKWPRS